MKHYTLIVINSPRLHWYPDDARLNRALSMYMYKKVLPVHSPEIVMYYSSCNFYLEHSSTELMSKCEIQSYLLYCCQCLTFEFDLSFDWFLAFKSSNILVKLEIPARPSGTNVRGGCGKVCLWDQTELLFTAAAILKKHGDYRSMICISSQQNPITICETAWTIKQHASSKPLLPPSSPMIGSRLEVQMNYWISSAGVSTKGVAGLRHSTKPDYAIKNISQQDLHDINSLKIAVLQISSLISSCYQISKEADTGTWLIWMHGCKCTTRPFRWKRGDSRAVLKSISTWGLPVLKQHSSAPAELDQPGG